MSPRTSSVRNNEGQAIASSASAKGVPKDEGSDEGVVEGFATSAKDEGVVKGFAKKGEASAP